MSLACLRPEATAAIRKRYGGMPPTTKARPGTWLWRGKVVYRWPAEDDQYVRTHAATRTVRQMAAALKRPPSNVRSHLHRLGLVALPEQRYYTREK